MYKSLLGLPTGTTKTVHHSFGTWIIPTVPFLEYSDDQTAILKPNDVEGFLAWVGSRDDYHELPPEISPKTKANRVGTGF